MTEFLLHWPVYVNATLFMALASGIWFAGSQLTLLADVLSDRLNLAKTIVGLLFLATATSLPEIATTFSAALVPDADMVLNNLFGGIALQTAILAFADFWTQGAISNYPRKAIHALEATLLVALLACLQIVLVIGEPYTFFWIGMGGVFVSAFYAGAILLLRRYDDNTDWVPVDFPDQQFEGQLNPLTFQNQDIKTDKLLLKALASCLAIFVLGIGLVALAEALAKQTGLGSGFVGAVFLAGATSLPELATTIAAVRIGAFTLAISNIFGSNLIMVVLVLPADILYTDGPILQTNSQSIQLAIALGIFVTTIYLIGLIIRRKPKIGRLGLDSFIVLIVYAVSLVLFYLVK